MKQNFSNKWPYMERPRMPSHVVIAHDATKDHSHHELMHTVDGVRKGGDILRRGDTILVLGVLPTVIHPMGYQINPCADSIGTSDRAVEEAVKRKVDGYVKMLLLSAKQCEDQGVSIEVKVTAGFPISQVILQEIMACSAAWVVLDRHLKQFLEFYLTHVPCKIALIEDTFAVEVVRKHRIEDTDTVKKKSFYSLSKRVPVLNCQVLIGSNNPSIVSSGRRYFVSIGSLENRNLEDCPVTSCERAEADKKSHRLTSTCAKTKRDRLLIGRERKKGGSRAHLIPGHCLSCITNGARWMTIC